MEEQIKSEKQEAISDLVGFDIRNWWTTFINLTKQPGDTIARFCNGERGKMISPFTYFLLAYSLNVLVWSFGNQVDIGPYTLIPIGEGSNQFTESFIAGFKASPNSDVTTEKINKVIPMANRAFNFMRSENGLIIIFLPIVCFFQWIFFKKYRRSFFHNYYFVLYTLAQINLFYLPVALVILPFNVTTTAPYLVVLGLGMVFYAWAERSFYPGIKWSGVVIRTIAQLTSSIIPFVLWFLTIYTITSIIIFKFLV